MTTRLSRGTSHLPIVVHVPTATAGAGTGSIGRRVVVVCDLGSLVCSLQHQIVLAFNAGLGQCRTVGHVVRPAEPQLMPHRNVRDRVDVGFDRQNILMAGEFQLEQVTLRLDVDVQRVVLPVLRREWIAEIRPEKINILSCFNL